MTTITVVLDKLSDWTEFYPSKQIMDADRYLEGRDCSERNRLIINLCKNYKYLEQGYYCSLLAEARGQKVIPDIRTINNLSRKNLYALDLENLNTALNRQLKRSKTVSGTDDTANTTLRIRIFFGTTADSALQTFASQLFDLFPCPVLEVSFKKTASWVISQIRAVSIDRLDDQEQDIFANALDKFSKKIWRKPRKQLPYRYDLAILVNPEEKLPPSNKRALGLFKKAANELGMDVDFIGKKDLAKLAEYDALFIRETTGISDHTFQFAKRAESEGMVVIDDPDSILRCTNKVYLANLLESHRVSTPRSIILNRNHRKDVVKIQNALHYPIVLKIPDGSFSRGIVKVKNEEELIRYSNEFFQNSALILAQEFFFTEYDWRIGVLNGEPLFACQYFMTRGHWQIYKHQANGRVQSGDFKTVPVSKAPAHVIEKAIMASLLIGKGLYGVDVKQRGNESVIIEVNDNPNIDAGIEDEYLGFDLYRKIMQTFLVRLENKRQGIRY